MTKPTASKSEEIQELRRRLQEAEAALSQLGDHSLLSAQLALESEGNFRALAENAIEAIFIVNAQGEFVYTNPQADKLVGYSPGELLSLHFSTIIQDEDLATVTERAMARLSGLPVPSRYEVYFKHRSGKAIPVEISVARTTWHNQPAIMAFAHDVSQRRQVEQALAWEMRVNLALAELGRHLLSPISLHQMSDLVLEQAKLLTNSPYGFVGYLQENGKLIVDTLSRDVWEECALENKSVIFDHFTGLWGWVIENGQPTWSNDHPQDPRAGSIPPGHIPIRRFAAAPAKQNGQVVGVIAVANSADLYTVKQIEFLERLGDIYAVALQRYWADEKMAVESSRAKSLAEIMEKLVAAGAQRESALKVVVQICAESLQATCAIFYTRQPSQPLQNCVVYDADPILTTLVEKALRQLPVEQGNRLVQQVRETGEGLLLSRLNQEEWSSFLAQPYRAVVELIGLNSLMVIPVKSPSGIFGVMVAARHTASECFSEQDFEFLQEISRRLSITLENTRLYEDLELHRSLLEQQVAERTAELQNERDFAHLVMNTVAQGLTVTSEEGRFIYVNHAFSRLIGYQPEELVGKTPKDISIPEDHAILDEHWQKRRWGETTSYENTLRHRDGSLIPVMITGAPRIQEGCFLGSVAAIRDLREGKRLQERQNWLQTFRDTLLTIAQVFIETTDENMDITLNQVLAQVGEFLKVDRTYIFHFDWKKGTMTNTHEWCAPGVSPQIENLQDIPNDFLPQWVEALQTQPNILIPAVAELPDSWESVRKILEDQEIQSLLVMPIRARQRLLGFVGFDSVKSRRAWQEDEVHLLAILADHLASLFERRRAEQALKESQSTYRLLAENVSDVILTFDLDFNILYVSPSVQQLTGYSPQEVIEKHFHELLTPASYQLLRRFVGQELSKERLKTLSPDQATTQTLDLEILRKDSTPRWIEAKANFIFDPWGKATEMICSVRDISERHQASQILEYMATHDPLTGLPNRTLFQDRLEHAIKRASRKNTQIAVLLIDLDHFKRINDTLGHLKGDQVLKDASRRLLASLRESDTVARMGGDEFTVILEDISDPKEIKYVAQKLMDAVSLPYEMEEGLWKLTASIGISIFPTDGTDMETLLRCADIAMYRAKRRRNRYTFY